MIRSRIRTDKGSLRKNSQANKIELWDVKHSIIKNCFLSDLLRALRNRFYSILPKTTDNLKCGITKRYKLQYGGDCNHDQEPRKLHQQEES
jgi:hypothetical protein